MTTSVCRRKFQVQAQQEKDNFGVIGLPWHNIGFSLEVKLTKWRDAGRAQGVKLTAAADPSRYEAGPKGQADAMLCVEPQSTKVRGVPFPPSSRPHKASARRSPRCLADANQNHREAPRRLSDGFGPANAGGREDSLKCVRLPSTPHGVLKLTSRPLVSEGRLHNVLQQPTALRGRRTVNVVS
ncbi:hypothetical protein PCANC_17310 [Puccinia coronata f. sp. avenae]|uniref:Uncharacterized protein n=1 Tax=Puccinia coronata f. sp. avenae TaxID=200324 RepID=A0A2N5SEQ4_9BASI|nr:hypothetical protein PCANC_17310 [Puccinia coronata f. sp. avenae]